MIINSLELLHYRNYQQSYLEFNPYINILVGLNGQGKTNLLESIFLAATSKSPRVAHNSDLVLFGQDNANVSVRFTNQNGKNYINFQVNHQDQKVIHINGKKIKKATDLLGYFNVVFFSPEDLSLVTGSPSERRRFLDIFISQVRPVYAVNLNDYNKVIKQRNKTLKDITQKTATEEMLSIWDQQLVNLAALIAQERVNALHRIQCIASHFYGKVSEKKELLVLQYESTTPWEDDFDADEYRKLFLQKLRHNQRQDIFCGNTSIGPHRDDIRIKLNDRDAKLFASQGQKRLISLSLKYAEVEYIYEMMREYPILLFDDVLLELDLSRKNRLFKDLLDKVQMIITTTDLNRYQDILMHESSIFKIHEGVVMKVKHDE